MKIKSKLLLALLVVALVPIGVGSVFFYYNSKSSLTNSFVNHLKSVSSIQHARTNAIVARNLERLALVASRTQLRRSIAGLLDNTAQQDMGGVNRILVDALASIEDFINISVYSPEGIVVASSDLGLIGKKHFDLEFLERCRKEMSVDYFSRDQHGNLVLNLSGPLFWENRLVGVIVIESRVRNFLSLVQDYSGLGRTGETLIVKRDKAGNSVFMLPTRFGKEDAVGRALLKGKNYASNYSFAGEKVLMDCIDYREQPVLAIGRYVEATGWGIVVKIDKEEAYAPVNSLRRMSVLMVLLGVVVVLVVALYIAAGISAPIDQLSAVAGKIAAGDLTRKADPSTNDEVGDLARSFNKMVDGLLSASADLHKKVGELRLEVTAHEQSEREKECLIEQLQNALAEIKTLQGIMPICASCKKIRDDQGLWSQVEAYISDHSEAEFTHGLCPDCAKALYPEIK